MSGEAVRNPTPSGPPSRSEGGFIPGAELHRSALAVLYLADREAERAGRPRYVLRRLLPEHADDPELRALLLREKFVASQVQSRHLTSVVSAFDGPVPFTVTEYVEGFSLEELLRRAGGQTHWVRFLVPAVVDALTGLAALHAVRDAQTGAPSLSHQAPVPRHILFGLDGIARLTDLTQCVGPGLPWSQACSRRLRVWEMAPEQVVAPAHVDHRCDIFVAGATLWRVLTGNTLFQGSSPQDTLQKVMRAPVPSLQEAGIPMDGGMDRVLRQALARSRHQRLDSAAEFCEALRRHAQQAGLWAERQEIAEFLATQWTANMLADPGTAHVRAAPPPRTVSAPAPDSGVSPLPEPLVSPGSGAHAVPSRFVPSRPSSLPPLIVRPESVRPGASTVPGMPVAAVPSIPAASFQGEIITPVKSFGASPRPGGSTPIDVGPDPLLGHTIDPYAVHSTPAAPFAAFASRAEPPSTLGDDSWEHARANASSTRPPVTRSAPAAEPWPPSPILGPQHTSDAAPPRAEPGFRETPIDVEAPVVAKPAWSLTRVASMAAGTLLLGTFTFLVVADLVAPTRVAPRSTPIESASPQLEPSPQADALPGEGAIAPVQANEDLGSQRSGSTAIGSSEPAAGQHASEAKAESDAPRKEPEAAAPTRTRHTSSSRKNAKLAESPEQPSSEPATAPAPLWSSPKSSPEPEWHKRVESSAESSQGPRVQLPDNPY